MEKCKGDDDGGGGVDVEVFSFVVSWLQKQRYDEGDDNDDDDEEEEDPLTK